MQLREYQQEAVESFFDCLRSGGNPVVALPTGSGKSLVIADICKRLAVKNGKVVVLAHVQELLQQNEQEYLRYSGNTNCGVYSAGSGRKEIAPVTFAGIQSVYSKPGLFADFNLVIVDEAHTVPPDGEGLMYTTLLQGLPNVRKGGFTATPWRLDNGVIYGEGRYFDTLCYQKSALELVEEGYLSPLCGVDNAPFGLNTSKVKKTAGDFSVGGISDLMEADDDYWLERASKDAVKILKAQKRKHVVIFCPTIETAKKTAAIFTKLNMKCGVVSSTDDGRDETLTAWKAGDFPAVANVDILTTGFNFPALDSIVCFRPTMSSALWVQMLGRGMRKAEGKVDALVLDYAGNLDRLGGVNIMETWLKQKDDGKLEEAKPKEEPKEKSKRRIHALSLSSLDPMLDSKEGLKVHVNSVSYMTRPGKKDGKQNMLALYDCETEDGIAINVSQFVCVEYTGYARVMAESWFKRRGLQAPATSRAAQMIAYSSKKPKQLQISRKEGYINVLKKLF